MRKLVLFVLILASAASVLQPALAYVLTGAKWPSPTTSMYVSLGGPWDDAFITAMNRWNQSTPFQFTYAPQSWDPCSNPNNPPRHNGVKFSDTLCGDSFGNSTLAVTETWTMGGSTIVQAGILFNTKYTWDVYDGPWSTGTYAGKSDFRRVAVHELGHVMGLDHEDSVPAIMATAVSTGGVIVAPTSDDTAGINAMYGSGTPVPGSPTANTYHVFPQFADGRAGDGSYYRTTLMVSNPSSTAASDCTFQLYGLTVNGQGTHTFTFAGSGWTILPINSDQALQSGYATLRCSAPVEAQLLYSFYSAAGTKVSEATVFSSPPAGMLQVLGDNRGGSQIAIAIANDSDAATPYTITAFDNSGNPVGSVTRTLSPRTSLAAFVSELISLPADYYGQVVVTSGGGTASLIGIRFSGAAFTTIPAVNRSALAPTASTYHVFPQFADGRAGDGSYYRTTVMIVNSSSSSGSCTLRLYGLTVNGNNVFNYGTFAPGTWTIITSISSMQNLRSGYATLQCGMPVEAQLLYSFYLASGTKISEATVFSSPPSGTAQVLADNRDGSSLAIAVANDSDQSATYTITAYGSSGVPVGAVSRTLSARTNLAAFLSDLISLPPNHYGPVVVTGNGAPSLIGIRFTGGAFTTIPETMR
ncbi:MAG TPA: matrixin family metalloprotease [Terriglobia bacterium]|nr:matrixin family metalloprotease [Terriglobia bacterium]